MAGILVLAGFLFGLFTTLVAPFDMVRKARAEAWPSRTAVITKSYALRKRGGRGAPYWQPQICGTYIDNGAKFCTTRVRFGDFIFGDGKSDADAAVAAHPVGASSNVYPNPDDPSEVILEARSSWRAIGTLFGLGLALLLLPWFLWLFRKRGPG